MNKLIQASNVIKRDLEKADKLEDFRTTREYVRLRELQDLTKRQPEMYEKEVVQYIKKFKAEYEVVKAKPGQMNWKFLSYGNYLSHVSHIF